jgi:hypothetical protein
MALRAARRDGAGASICTRPAANTDPVTLDWAQDDRAVDDEDHTFRRNALDDDARRAAEQHPPTQCTITASVPAVPASVSVLDRSGAV